MYLAGVKDDVGGIHRSLRFAQDDK